MAAAINLSDINLYSMILAKHFGDFETYDQLRVLSGAILAGLDKKVAAIAPELAKDPGMMKRISKACSAAAEKVNLFLVKHQEKIDALGKLLGAAIDTPADMKKFGYEPTILGTAHASNDPMRIHFGIGSHLACTIAAHALTAAFRLAKRGLKGRKEGVETGDVYDLAGELLAQVFSAINGELGFEGGPAAAAIAGKLRELLASRAEARKLAVPDGWSDELL